MKNSWRNHKRLYALGAVLLATESVNTYKSAQAFAWTNAGPFGVVAALTMAAFLIGSVVALSFPLEDDVKLRLELIVLMVFAVQTGLTCGVSYLEALKRMPAQQLGTLLGTSAGGTLRFVALAEAASINFATLGMWGILGSQWKKEIEGQKRQHDNLRTFAERPNERWKDGTDE